MVEVGALGIDCPVDLFNKVDQGICVMKLFADEGKILLLLAYQAEKASH